MELFAITRYQGDEEKKEKSSISSTRADQILKKLHADAEAKKKQRRSQTEKPLQKAHKNQSKEESEEKVKGEKKESLESSHDKIGQKPKARKHQETDSDEEVVPVKKKKKIEDSRPNKKDGGSKKDRKLPESYCESTDNKGEGQTMSPSSKSRVDTVKSDGKRKGEVRTSSDSEEDEKAGDESAEMAGDESAEMVDDQEGTGDYGGFTVLGNYKTKTAEKVSRVLPDWLASPNVIASDLTQKTSLVSEVKGLDPDILSSLKESQIEYFFPVQMQVIPEILSTVRHGFVLGSAGLRPPDICVSAPTGSGKTLAFVLPIVQALKKRVLCRIRALVVLPVQDLAVQVYRVFLQYTKGTNLKVGSTCGQKQFSVEQHALVKQTLGGLESKVDILVATPGRLVDHINDTPGFSLSDLRFLVIDEADRIIEHVKQDWLSHVEKAVFTEGRVAPSSLNVHHSLKHQMPLQKLLFSATLSQNPEKLKQLNLFQPKLFTSVVDDRPLPKSPFADSADRRDEEGEGIQDRQDELAGEVKGQFVGKYTTPSGLKEYTVEVEPSEKPLVILHFLHNLKYRHVLCFTNSVESTHRLYHLIKLFGDIQVAEITSNLQASRRNKVLRKFQNGDIDILICSDAMARGMDIENVEFVISYDPPPYIKTYIHRVGRTARAGKEGTALTLLQKKEFHHFKTMTKEAGKISIGKFTVITSDLEGLLEGYQSALQELPQVLKKEKNP